MKKAVFATLLVVVAMLTTVFAVSAQAEATTIEYNTVLNDTIADGEVQQYSFKGESNDLVLISLDTDYAVSGNTFQSPQVALISPAGTELARTESYAAAIIFYELPEEGVYTIELSSTAGGEYVFQLVKPEVLTPDTPVSGTVVNTSTQYYVYTADVPFTISYERAEGDFRPEIAVFITGEYGLETAASISGTQVMAGQITVEPAADTAYLIALQEALFDLYFEDVQADYTLTLTQPQ